jgi:hypothetical protein
MFVFFRKLKDQQWHCVIKSHTKKEISRLRWIQRQTFKEKLTAGHGGTNLLSSNSNSWGRRITSLRPAQTTQQDPVSKKKKRRRRRNNTNIIQFF